MFQTLFKIIINLVATMLQLVLVLPNAALAQFLPDVSDKILQVTNSIAEFTGYISWGLGLIPKPVLLALIFIVTCEIAKHSVYVLTHTFFRLWKLIQRIKFW